MNLVKVGGMSIFVFRTKILVKKSYKLLEEVPLNLFLVCT